MLKRMGTQTANGSDIAVRGKSCIFMAHKRNLVRNGSLKEPPGEGVSMFRAARTKMMAKDEAADKCGYGRIENM